jgi:hypothetical protein
MKVLERAVHKTLKKVVVIDDAYAPADPADIDGDAISRFTNALVDDPKRISLLKKEFPRETLDPSVPQDIETLVQDPATIRRLWELRDRKVWGWLTDSLFQSYVEDVSQKRSDLAGLEKIFSRSRWKVDKLPKFDKATLDVTACQVIFLDFYLKGETAAESALERASELAHLIIQARQTGKLIHYPLIILMSSRPGASGRQEEFKSRTGLRSDFFCFIEKAEINQRIDSKLDSLLADYPGKQALAHLLDEYWLAAIRSATMLRQNLAMVEPSELALLYEAELAVEEAVLPDYLSWLVSESLASGLLEDSSIRTLGRKLPDLIGQSAFPGAVPPSSRIADMYVRSIMRLDITDDIQETKTVSIELGDIFARLTAAGEPSEFFLVVDQSCDLARPDSSKKINVLCLQCKPQLLSDVALAFYRNHVHLPDSVMADLVSMQVAGNTRYYLAKWEMVNPATPKLSDLTKRKGNLKRLARLKPVSALARQEGLTQRVGRIGEPVAPPFVSAYRAKLVLHGKNGFKRELDATKEAWASAIVVQGRHMARAEASAVDASNAGATKRKVAKPKTSTSISLTLDFSEWLLGKLGRAKLEDSQAASQAKLFIENLNAGPVQRLALEAGQGEQGLIQLTRRASMAKPKLALLVVFSKTVPPELKNEPLVLLLTPYGEGEDLPSKFATGETA